MNGYTPKYNIQQGVEFLAGALTGRYYPALYPDLHQIAAAGRSEKEEIFRHWISVLEDKPPSSIDDAINFVISEVRGTLRNSDRDRRIFLLRAYLIDGDHHTLEGVGKDYGITGERIRQIQQKIVWGIDNRIHRSHRSPERRQCLNEILGLA